LFYNKYNYNYKFQSQSLLPNIHPKVVLLIAIFYPPPSPFIFSYPSCSGARAPGLAADMHFQDDVIAFIGPACAFALEPVARLAAYWNTPIITGMGDQVRIQGQDADSDADSQVACQESQHAVFNYVASSPMEYGTPSSCLIHILILLLRTAKHSQKQSHLATLIVSWSWSYS